MKLFTTITCMLLISFCAVAQRDYDAEMKKAELQVEKEIKAYKSALEKEYADYPDGYGDMTLTLEFNVDTARIERLMQARMEVDYSTAGMMSATYKAEEEYDALLNKYYKRLLAKLSKEDKEILRESQRNWITFRDSERKLNRMLSAEEYSGGGTIQGIIVAGRTLDITASRVSELYRYLDRVEGW